jgi:hypothetical protein
MISWLKGLFQRRESVDAGRSDPAEQPSGSPGSDLLSRLMEAEVGAWWKDKISLVAKTDEQFAVIGPRADATVEELESLGKQLRQWQEAHTNARHIWGLEDLLAGQVPRTPRIYLMVPFSIDSYAESYEPVALIFVAQGTDHGQARESLLQALGETANRLAWCTSPAEYSQANR